MALMIVNSLDLYSLFSSLYRLPQGQQEVQQRKILYMGLYLLIWVEAANVRFMPECLCYIFDNVSTIHSSIEKSILWAYI